MKETGIALIRSSRTLLSILLVLAGCAKERPVRRVLANGRRLPKSTFTGTYLFEKTLTDIQYASKELSPLPVGLPLETEKLVQFVFKETSLDVVSIDPLFSPTRPVRNSSLIASFGVKYVDVLRKLKDDKETSEEEETDTRRPWQEREFLILDAINDSQDGFVSTTKTASPPESIGIDSVNGAINFTVERNLKDNTQLKIRYSLLKFTPSQTYEQREYPLELRTQFGFFPTVTYKFDKYGNITEEDRKIFINRWDVAKPIVFYFSKNFPEHLKGPSREVMIQWENVFKGATNGKARIEMRDNTGQELGDLRYNIVHYDDTIDASHDILGAGFNTANPRTGEIINAHIVLYGRTLKDSVAKERQWQRLLGDFAAEPAPALMTFVENNMSFLSGVFIPGHGRLEADRLLTLNTRFTPAPKLSPEIFNLLAKAARPETSQLQENSFPDRVSKALNNPTFRQMRQNFTELSAEVVSGLQRTDLKQLSDQDLETVIFRSILTHEGGHGFGLKHNLMGSFDREHFEGNTETSTVMDYGWLLSKEPPSPQSYDKAAITIAYSSNESEITRLKNENFYYCSDEHTDNPQYAACQRYDAGTSLGKIAESLSRRYYAAWFFNNFRNNRIHSDEATEYIEKISSELRPLRHLYDNAETILEMSHSKEGGQPDLVGIWRLSQQRIEANVRSRATDIVSVEVPAKVLVADIDGKIQIKTEKLARRIDRTKLDALFNDATETKKKTFQALAGILFDKRHPDHNVYNNREGNLEVRGVIKDKLQSLLFLGQATPDPLGRPKVLTVYRTLENAVMRDLISSLLSDAPLFPGIANFSGYDINLRDMAFRILTTELAVEGTSPIARELVAIEKVRLEPDSPELRRDELSRSPLREQRKLLLRKGLSDTEKTIIKLRIQALEQKRTRETETVYVRLTGNQYARAAVRPPQLGFETASSRLIRDNINPWEDFIQVALETQRDYQREYEAEMAKPVAPSVIPEGQNRTQFRDPDRVRDLEKQIRDEIPKLREQIADMNEMISYYKIYLEKFYRFYELGLTTPSGVNSVVP